MITFGKELPCQPSADNKFGMTLEKAMAAGAVTAIFKKSRLLILDTQ
jgi:hypothetical protein